MKHRKRGRPRKPEQIRQLIIDIAKATGWGYTRILGELKKLRVYNISRATVSRVLRKNGLEPGPKRGRGSWHDFIERHFKTLWATDFFTKKVWTMRGPGSYYISFFIHLQTRRVHIAGMTPDPDCAWMAQMARNMSMFFSEQPTEFRPTHIIRDRDSKFTERFCSILKTDGIDFRANPPHSRNWNSYAEAYVGRTKAECLNHFFIVFGENHLRHILDEWTHFYHCQRPHRARSCSAPSITSHAFRFAFYFSCPPLDGGKRSCSFFSEPSSVSCFRGGAILRTCRVAIITRR